MRVRAGLRTPSFLSVRTAPVPPAPTTRTTRNPVLLDEGRQRRALEVPAVEGNGPVIEILQGVSCRHADDEESPWLEDPPDLVEFNDRVRKVLQDVPEGDHIERVGGKSGIGKCASDDGQAKAPPGVLRFDPCGVYTPGIPAPLPAHVQEETPGGADIQDAPPGGKLFDPVEFPLNRSRKRPSSPVGSEVGSTVLSSAPE